MPVIGFSAHGEAYGCLAGALFGSISGAFDGKGLRFWRPVEAFYRFSPLLVFPFAAEFASFNQQPDKESRMNENAALCLNNKGKTAGTEGIEFHMDLT